MSKSKPLVQSVSRVYVAYPADGFELCQPVSGDGWARLAAMDRGEIDPMTVAFPKMRMIRHNMGRNLKKSDAPLVTSGFLFLRMHAFEVVEGVVSKDCDCIRTMVDSSEFVCVHPRAHYDALDESRSEIVRGQESRLILSVERHVFLSGRIGPAALFKLSCLRFGPVYAQQTFVDHWTRANLSGLRFLPA